MMLTTGGVDLPAVYLSISAALSQVRRMSAFLIIQVPENRPVPVGTNQAEPVVLRRRQEL
jgi:hypothetical protein